MGTAATVSKVCGPNVCGDHYEYVLSLALDSTDASGLQTVDLTPYLSYIYSLQIADNDAVADNVYVYRGVCPAKTVALTSTNVAISVHYSTTGAPIALVPVASAALTGVGALKIIVKGRAAV